MIEALRRRLGYRSLGRPVAFALAAGSTSLLLLWFLAALGFRDPSRWPDIALMVAALLPMAWFVSVRLAPALSQRLRARRSSSRVLLQNGVERRLDWLGPTSPGW